ncbi:MAG: 50S ribosomal protein L28 [Myxococcota bacterium]
MAVCQLTGKAFLNGHRVSHSNIKTKHRRKANVQKKRIYDVATGCFVRVKLSTRALRMLTRKPLAGLLRRAAGRRKRS